MPLYVFRCESGHETTLLRPIAARNVPHACRHPLRETAVPVTEGDEFHTEQGHMTKMDVCGQKARLVPSVPGAVNGNFTEKFYGR